MWMISPQRVRNAFVSNALRAHGVSLLVKYVFNWYQNDYKTFAHFCEALEVDNGQVAPKEGWGLDHTMKAWGKYWNETFYPMGAYRTTCVGRCIDADVVLLQFAARVTPSGCF